MTKKNLIYFQDGKVVAKCGDVTVYKMNNDLFLEIGPGHNLWALESEIVDYMYQLESYPNGEVLEIGLGLGVVSRYLLTFPNVKRVTTVEINPDVIGVNKLIPEEDRNVLSPMVDKQHIILESDGISYAYTTKRMYDFIFIDCYDAINEDTLPLIADMVHACSKVLKPTGKLMGWLDKYTPEPYYDTFYRLIEDV